MTTNDIQPLEPLSPTLAEGASVGGQKRKPPAGKKAIAATRFGLVSGALPKKFRWASKTVDQYRRALERAVLDARQAISIVDAGFVLTACRHERAALVAQRQLTENHDSLAPLERSKLATDVAKASEGRDKAVERLDLGGTSDAFTWPTAASVYEAPSKPAAAPEPDGTPTAEDAASTPPAATEKPTIDSDTIEGNQ